ncbi:MAG: nickel-dependent lactate racemase [Candidatus Bathyarchaeia archaeon]
MVEVWLPYGKTEICLTISAENFLGTIEPQLKPAAPDPEAEIKYALENPKGSPRLREIVRSGGKVAVVVDSTTNMHLSQLMLSKVIDELKSGGISESAITIIFGQRSQPSPDRSSSLEVGDLGGLVKLAHDPNTAELVEVGVTSYKTRVVLNRAFAEADFKVLIGEIGLDPYAGYSGGRAGVLAVSGFKTIQHNRSLITDPNCKVGNLEKNPVHLDMVEAAKLAGVNFILNAVTDDAGKIVKAFAGGLEPAFLEGAKFLAETLGATVDSKSDIVVISPGGYPYDDSFYNAINSLENVLAIVRDGGVVVLAAECSNGHGNVSFYRWMTQFRSFEDAREAVRKSFTPELCAAYLLLRTLQKVRVVALSAMPEFMTTGVFKLKSVRCTDEALETAFRLAGRKAKVWVVPRGQFTLPRLRSAEPSQIAPG